MVRKTRVHQGLVAEVKNARRATQKKLYRVEARGTKIRESSHNPSRGVSATDIENMSTPQLRKHLSELRAFTNRGTQFVPGESGAPIRRSTWNAIREAQAKLNQRAQQYVASIGNIEVPGSGMDISGRMEARKRLNRFRAKGQRKTFEEGDHPASGITGEESAQELLKGLQDQLKGNYLNKRMKTTRENLKVMLATTGDEDIAKQVDKLTNNQLNILVDYSYFMDAIQGRYLYAKAMNVAEQKDYKNHWTYSEYQDNGKRMQDLIGWASTLPKSARDNDTRNRPTNWNPNNTNAGPIPKQFNPNDTRARSIPIQFNPNDTSARSIPTQRSKRRKPK